MTERNERAVLNDLILTCRDAARGFEWAAEHAHDPQVKALFSKIAAERHQHVMELLPHAWWLGGIPHGDGSRIAALHRAWMTVKDRLASDHDHAILAETERGERVALAAYEQAINSILPPETRELLEKQRASIRAAYARLEALTPTA